MSNGSKKPLEITAVTPRDLAAILSGVHRRKTTQEKTPAIANELGCSWHKVDRIVQNIRGQFEEHGFGEE